MIDRLRPGRRSAALALVLLLTAVSVIAPLVDRGGGVGAVSLSDGSAPTGYVEHDHQLCLQYGATAWAPAVGVDTPPAFEALAQPCEPDGAARPEAAHLLSHHARAPPLS